MRIYIPLRKMSKIVLLDKNYTSKCLPDKMSHARCGQGVRHETKKGSFIYHELITKISQFNYDDYNKSLSNSDESKKCKKFTSLYNNKYISLTKYSHKVYLKFSKKAKISNMYCGEKRHLYV